MSTQSVLQAKRPGMVVVMVVLRVVNALFGLLTAFMLLSSGASDVLVIGTVVATLSILSLIFTVGLWMLRRWARLLTIGLAIVGLPLAIFGIVASGGRDPGTYLGVVQEVFTLYVLFHPRIKHLFT